MTTVVFYVLPRLPSTVAIFALGGVFSAQALLDCLYLKWSPCTAWCRGYVDVDEHRLPEKKSWATVLENKLSRLVALVLQFFSAVTLAVIPALQCEPKDRFLVGFGTALSLLVLAAVWSSKVQQESHRARKMAERTKGSNIICERERALPSAGFKSSKQYHLLLLPCLLPPPLPFPSTPLPLLYILSYTACCPMCMYMQNAPMWRMLFWVGDISQLFTKSQSIPLSSSPSISPTMLLLNRFHQFLTSNLPLYPCLSSSEHGPQYQPMAPRQQMYLVRSVCVDSEHVVCL